MGKRFDNKMAIYYAKQAWDNHEDIEKAVARALLDYKPRGNTRQSDIAIFIRVFLQNLGYLKTEDYEDKVEWQMVHDIIQ